MSRLCWRHEGGLIAAAFGSMFDLSGKLYLRWGKRILTDAHSCERCQAKSAKSA